MILVSHAANLQSWSRCPNTRNVLYDSVLTVAQDVDYLTFCGFFTIYLA